jgi:Protein of unknown function, DUF481
MFQKLFLVILSFFLFAPAAIAEDAASEQTAVEKAAIKQHAAEETQSAEDELLKLEQAVGEDSEKEDPALVEDSKPETTTAKQEESSKPWLPAAKEYDWVQLTSGEWLKGEIKSMYNDSLEFDSDKLNLLIIDWADVKYLKSYRPSKINLENHEPIAGSLQISGHKITITDGEGVHEFDRLDLISLTPSGERELDLWAVKFTLGLNVRNGNTNQLDYNSKLSAKRRAARSRFVLDYIGNISKTGNEEGVLTETINNNRITSSINIYATRYFFYTPLFAEYFRDPFQNVDQRITAGVGLGYTIFDSGKFEWNVNGGPAFLTTKYISVQPGEKQQIDAAALVFGTDIDTEVTSTLDFIFRYNIQASKKEVGGYTHSVIATFESEITDSLDFDISMTWDRISQPTENENGVIPEPDDYRLTVGITYTY